MYYTDNLNILDCLHMISVTAAEFQRNFGHYQDKALRQPVSITRNGRDRLVVLSVEDYQRLEQVARRGGLDLTDHSAANDYRENTARILSEDLHSLAGQGGSVQVQTAAFAPL